MGVHGLTSYILGNSSLYLKPYELSDCHIVIDGSNVAHGLARKLKSSSAFGGDYDEYFTLVRSFMLALKKCNVFPIILFDGGCEKRKIKTRLNRRHTKVENLKFFSQGFSREVFFPLFLLEVFINAVRDVGFLHAQCNLEADGEIATVARKLNCPVLSNDSDYFIYDVLYIPFNTLKPSPIKYSNSSKHYLQCLMYNVDEFLETLGIDKPLLPILATLLGNDYVENIVFFKFFNHVRMPNKKNQSHAQKRISGLIQWLKNENINTAVNNIISHLRKGDAEKVSKLFNSAINDYRTSIVSETVLNELSSKFDEIKLSKSDFSVTLPPEIAKLFAQSFIPGFIMNIILHQLYLTPIQVENIYDQSSHFKSLKLIKKIYAMFTPYLKSKKPLQLYLIVKKQYTAIKIEADPSDYINLNEVLKQPLEERLKLLCEIVGVTMDELKFMPCNSWAIFIMGFLYWVKEFNNSVSLAHIHAFVIMMIANQIVQSKIGYFRNSPEFMKRNGDKFKKLRGTELIPKESSNFQEMLFNLNTYECIVVQKELIPFRRTTKENSHKEFCLPTIHLFNCFQSCLYYIKIINALLNHPLPNSKIEGFYSGTLLFNLYMHIKSKSNVEKFGSALFLKTPTLNQIYKYLSVKLVELSGVSQVNSRVPKRKRNKKKKDSSVKVLENINYSTDDESEFTDENNMYTALYKIKNLSVI